MKKLLFLLLIFFAFPFISLAESEPVTVYYFEDRLCPVCAETEKFLENIAEERDGVELEIYSISETEKLKEIAEQHGVEDYYLMAPTIFIGESFLQPTSFSSKQEKNIIDAIEGEIVERDCCIATIPILNIEVDTSKWSLPLAAAGLGIVDGFNVCSIGALILIIVIVLSFDSRRKMFLFGGLFIATTVLVYGALVFLWSWLLEALIKDQEIIRIFIGLAALGGGAYFFKEFLRFFRYGPTCDASQSGIAKRATEKLKSAFERSGAGGFYLALSVISFAALITIVELPCSVGIPLTFSGILAGAEISLLSHILYIVIFLFFYMLIELVIFTGAVLTKSIWFATPRMITWVTFLGAVVLFYIALYYLPWFFNF